MTADERKTVTGSPLGNSAAVAPSVLHPVEPVAVAAWRTASEADPHGALSKPSGGTGEARQIAESSIRMMGTQRIEADFTMKRQGREEF